MDKTDILKAKTLKEIKEEFDKLFDKLFFDNRTLNQEVAQNLISSIIKLVPSVDKYDFARFMIIENAIWCTDNQYEAIGMLEFCKNDILTVINNDDYDDENIENE